MAGLEGTPASQQSISRCENRHWLIRSYCIEIALTITAVALAALGTAICLSGAAPFTHMGPSYPYFIASGVAVVAAALKLLYRLRPPPTPASQTVPAPAPRTPPQPPQPVAPTPSQPPSPTNDRKKMREALFRCRTLAEIQVDQASINQHDWKEAARRIHSSSFSPHRLGDSGVSNIARGVKRNQRVERETEDAHFAESLTVCGQDAFVVGVCDGHGGPDVSKIVAREFPRRLETIRQNNQIEAQIQAICSAIDAEEREKNMAGYEDPQTKEIERLGVFATALISAVILPDTIYVANNGDSRMILLRSDGSIRQITQDHDPRDPEILARLQEEERSRENSYEINYTSSGEIKGVNGYGLASHIGGMLYGDLPCWTDITVLNKGVDYDAGDILVMGCDGLFDVASTNEVGSQVRKMVGEGKTLEEMSRILVDGARQSGSTDDITVMISRLK